MKTDAAASCPTLCITAPATLTPKTESFSLKAAVSSHIAVIASSPPVSENASDVTEPKSSAESVHFSAVTP